MARSLILPTLPILNITAFMSKGIGSQPSTSVKQQLVNQHTEDDDNDVTDDDVIRKASEQMLNCSEVNSTDWSETTGINEEFGLLRRRQSRGKMLQFFCPVTLLY